MEQKWPIMPRLSPLVIGYILSSNWLSQIWFNVSVTPRSFTLYLTHFRYLLIMSKRGCFRRLWLNPADNATNVLPKLRVTKGTLIAIGPLLKNSTWNLFIVRRIQYRLYHGKGRKIWPKLVETANILSNSCNQTAKSLKNLSYHENCIFLPLD